MAGKNDTYSIPLGAPGLSAIEKHLHVIALTCPTEGQQPSQHTSPPVHEFFLHFFAFRELKLFNEMRRKHSVQYVFYGPSSAGILHTNGDIFGVPPVMTRALRDPGQSPLHGSAATGSTRRSVITITIIITV